MAFAVGGLIGDVFLHSLPHEMGAGHAHGEHGEHEDHHQHGHR